MLAERPLDALQLAAHNLAEQGKTREAKREGEAGESSVLRQLQFQQQTIQERAD